MQKTRVDVEAKEADKALAPVGGLDGILGVLTGMFGADDDQEAEAKRHPVLAALDDALRGGAPVTLTVATPTHEHVICIR